MKTEINLTDQVYGLIPLKNIDEVVNKALLLYLHKDIDVFCDHINIKALKFDITNKIIENIYKSELTSDSPCVLIVDNNLFYFRLSIEVEFGVENGGPGPDEYFVKSVSYLSHEFYSYSDIDYEFDLEEIIGSLKC